MPNVGQWIAPTLDPDELDKRIEELRTVQFWLEQNARLLAATIQALEVQRMTLSTLKTMNVTVSDLRQCHEAAERPRAPAATARRAACQGAHAPSKAPPATPRSSRRGRPDAVVGRADAAVHATGRAGDAETAAPTPPSSLPARWPSSRSVPRARR